MIRVGRLGVESGAEGVDEAMGEVGQACDELLDSNAFAIATDDEGDDPEEMQEAIDHRVVPIKVPNQGK